MAAQVALRRQNTGDDLSSNSSKKSLNEEENTSKSSTATKMNRTSYLNSQLNLKRLPMVRTKLTSDLAEQNNNLKRLKEEQSLKNSIKKSLNSIF